MSSPTDTSGFNSFSDIFEFMKQRLDITDTAKKVFIDPIKPLKLNNRTVTLYIENDWAKNVIRDNYDEMFKKELKDILGFEVEIQYLSSADGNLSPDERVLVSNPIPELDDDPYAKNRMHETEENSNYKYSFDTFIVGESNKLASSACRSIAQGQA